MSLMRTRKGRRLLVLVLCLTGLGTAAGLAMLAFRDNLVFFVTPGDLAAAPPPAGRMLRLGGLVEAGSVARDRREGRPVVRFRVVDGSAGIEVEFAGILPDLFREGQGVVTLGTLRADGRFLASEVLAKHDETYMPPEVAEALRKSGQWKPESGQKPAAGGWTTAPAGAGAGAGAPQGAGAPRKDGG